MLIKRTIKAGSTSQILTVVVLDSASTTGGRKTGIAPDATDFTCRYKRSNGTAAVACAINSITTLGTFAGSDTNAAWKEVSAADMPGVYELHLPNNMLASGATDATLTLKGAAGMVQVDVQVELVANVAADVYSRVGAPTGASVSADVAAIDALIDAIKAKTDNLPASPAATGDIPSESVISTAVWTQLLGALETADADQAAHLLILAQQAAADAYLVGVSAEQSATTAAASAANADTNTQTILSDIATVDGVVDGIAAAQVAPLDATATQAAAAAALAAYDAPTKAELDAAIAGIDVTVDLSAVAKTSELQPAAAAAITAYDPPTKAELDSAIGGVTVDVDLTPVTDAIGALHDFDPAMDTVARVTLVDTVTAVTEDIAADVDLSGVELTLDAIKAKTDNIPASPAVAGAAATKADVDAAVATISVDASAIAEAVDGSLSAAHGSGRWDSTSPVGEDWVSVTDHTLDDSNVAIGVGTVAGVPRAGIDVIAYSGGVAKNSTETLGDGSFDLPLPRGATYSVVFAFDGAISEARTVTIDA